MDIKTQILTEHLDIIRVHEEMDTDGNTFYKSTQLDDKISDFTDQIISEGGSVLFPYQFIAVGEFLVCIISYNPTKINSNIVVPQIKLQS